MEELKLTSPAFTEGESIPSVYTCDGDNISPPLEIKGVPTETKSLVILMDDPDIPEVVKKSRAIEKFDHWVLFNIPATRTELTAGDAGGGTAGSHTGGEQGYTGPCPPLDHEPTEHRYFFQLYALDTTLDLTEGATMQEVKDAMKGHIINKAELMGRYDRSK